MTNHDAPQEKPGRTPFFFSYFREKSHPVLPECGKTPPPFPGFPPLARHLGTVGLALWLGGCALLGSSPGTPPTPSAKGDQIVHVALQKPVSQGQLVEQMRLAKVVYLGERHNNPNHHRVQREVLAQLLATGVKPAIAFETFTQDQTGWLMNYSQSGSGSDDPAKAETAATFMRQGLGWAGKPQWDDYFPLLALARHHKLPTVGIDLPKGSRIRLTRAGMEGLLPVERAGLDVEGGDQPNYAELMRRLLSQAHCDALPPKMVEKMYQTWIARNNAMAQAIITLSETWTDGPVIVILGAGHIAHDLGVPERVAFSKPGIIQVNVGLREHTSPEDAAKNLLDHAPGMESISPHRYLWTTAPTPEGKKSEEKCPQFQ